jgi:hypothetical protein
MSAKGEFWLKVFLAALARWEPKHPEAEDTGEAGNARSDPIGASRDTPPPRTRGGG